MSSVSLLQSNSSKDKTIVKILKVDSKTARGHRLLALVWLSQTSIAGSVA